MDTAPLLSWSFTSRIALQRGQVLILVVFAMVVTLTIGLSVAARSITNLRNTSDEQSSQRALSLAEAGLEEVINKTGSSTAVPPAGSLPSSDSYNASITTVIGQNVLVNNGTTLHKDEPADIWLSTPPSYSSPWSGNLTVYWTKNTVSGSTDSDPAVEIVVIDHSPVYKLTHYVFDAYAGRRATNGFAAPSGPGGTIQGQAFDYNSPSITITNGAIARVIPLYAGTNIALHGSLNLPAQGQTIVSTGTAAGTERKITAYKAYPKLPAELFPYSIFCPKAPGDNTSCKI